MKNLPFALALLCLATQSEALVLLPPVAMNAKVIGGVLQVQTADCYPSTHIVDTKVFNPSDRLYEGQVQLMAVTAERQEQVTRNFKLAPGRAERIAFDFGKNICKTATELRFQSQPAQ